MSSSREIYGLLLISCAAGYAYLFYSMSAPEAGHGTLCLFKNITGIACPSCGSTRAVIALFQGRVYDSLSYNPFGLAIAAIMLISPVWVTRDLFLKQESLFARYRQIEKWLVQPAVYLPAIMLVLINWAWNILKGI